VISKRSPWTDVSRYCTSSPHTPDDAVVESVVVVVELLVLVERLPCLPYL
jgi:hypothetical protein